MAVGSRDEGSSLQGYGVRDQRSARDAVVFVEQDARKDIKMRGVHLSDRTQLAGAVVSRDPTPLNLVANPIRADGVDVGMRLARLFPVKCLTEKILRKIAGRIVRASGDASPAKLVRGA